MQPIRCPDFILHNSSFILCSPSPTPTSAASSASSVTSRAPAHFLTSRPLVIATGRQLTLQELDHTAALNILADLASDNSALDAIIEDDTFA